MTISALVMYLNSLTQLVSRDALTGLNNRRQMVRDIENALSPRLEPGTLWVIMGDLDRFTRRDRIAVMREINGKMVMRYLDPRSSKVFNDPFLMMQQNDFIITSATNGGTLRSEFSYWWGMIGTLTSVASLITSIALFITVKKDN